MCGRYYIEIEEDEMMSIIREVQQKVNRPEQLVRKGQNFSAGASCRLDDGRINCD